MCPHGHHVGSCVNLHGSFGVITIHTFETARGLKLDIQYRSLSTLRFRAILGSATTVVHRSFITSWALLLVCPGPFDRLFESIFYGAVRNFSDVFQRTKIMQVPVVCLSNTTQSSGSPQKQPTPLAHAHTARLPCVPSRLTRLSPRLGLGAVCKSLPRPHNTAASPARHCRRCRRAPPPYTATAALNGQGAAARAEDI